MKLRELNTEWNVVGKTVTIPNVGRRVIRFWSPGNLWVHKVSDDSKTVNLELVELSIAEVMDLEVEE